MVTVIGGRDARKRGGTHEIEGLPVTAVIMAGGPGQRLRPLTRDVPKPLLPVGARPLLEIIVEQLRDAGIDEILIATHYREQQIIDHFEDGRRFDVSIDYLREQQPRGTAGGLSLLGPVFRPVLVINGDVLARVDYRAMVAFHQQHHAAMTVATKEYTVSVPYGVLETEGSAVLGVTEKPRLRYSVSAGVYVLGPHAIRSVPREGAYAMTTLIEKLAREEKPIASYPLPGYWRDIGKMQDYEQAQRDIGAGAI